MKILAILTRAYPYAPPSEQFLEGELGYLSEEFDQVYLFPTSRSSETEACRETPYDNVKVIKLKRKNKILEIMEAFFTNALWSKQFYGDIIQIIRKKSFTKDSFLQFAAFHTNGYIVANKVYNELKKQHISHDDYLVVYSYWLMELAYSAARIRSWFQKKSVGNVVAISRAHGSCDIFCTEETRGFKPCLRFINSNLNRIYSISEAGKDYLIKLGFGKEKIYVSRLGVSANGTALNNCEKTFTVVSCAIISEVKRVDLIIEALSKTKCGSIQWVHFGGGPLVEKNAQQAHDMLDETNIQWELKGNIANNQILKYYHNTKPDVFINVSSIEGIPVSIMEAISFAIPVIATDVGGTREICKNGIDGILLSSNPSAQEIADAITKIYNSDELRYKFSAGSRDVFIKNYDAEHNFSQFAKDIVCL